MHHHHITLSGVVIGFFTLLFWIGLLWAIITLIGAIAAGVTINEMKENKNV